MGSEQWKEQGKCNECRRKGYCTKPCKAYRERMEYEIGSFLVRKMFQKGEK